MPRFPIEPDSDQNADNRSANQTDHETDETLQKIEQRNSSKQLAVNSEQSAIFYC